MTAFCCGCGLCQVGVRRVGGDCSRSLRSGYPASSGVSYMGAFHELWVFAAVIVPAVRSSYGDTQGASGVARSGTSVALIHEYKGRNAL